MHIYFLQVMSCLDNEEHYENVYWNNIKCGHVTLNENKSLRDIEEIR